LKQILINAGKDPEEIMDTIYKDLKVEEMREDQQNTKGYNVVTESFGDMYEAGIIDPLKVTKQAVLNAISVATTILTTNAIITHARK
jgi:chaperonin GroEL